MKEAGFYKKLEQEKVHCFLCQQHCRIESGDRGKCGVRENRSGTLWSLVYERPIAMHVDPIEKKPLYHFYPGTLSYSLGTVGCNFSCLFCQNADIAHQPKKSKSIQGKDLSPNQIAEDAQKTNCKSIAYTYTEPTIFMEYALDIAEKAHNEKLTNVFVTNGYMTPEALQSAAPLLDAANVDLKAFNDEFYKNNCDARLKPVLQCIEKMKQENIWVEVTTLLIPGLNDSDRELKDLTNFLLSVDQKMPWHVSAFYPTYRMTDRPPTAEKTLEKARKIGLEAGLKYVYMGNIPHSEGRNTYCSHCGKLLIERTGFSAQNQGVIEGKCNGCQNELPGVGWQYF